MGVARRVLVVGYPGAEMLDIACPADVFDAANRVGAEPGYRVELVSPTGRFRCQNGIRMETELLAEVDGSVDTLIVAGGVGHEAASSDPALLAQVRRLARCSRRVASVCTGVTVLARAGLLAGRRVTTHWVYADRLAADHPELAVDAAPLYIKDGNVYTAAGVTSGLDLALSLVDEDHGPALARRSGRALVTYVLRPGDQDQVSMFLAARGSEQRVLDDLTRLIANQPGTDLSPRALAARAGVGTRQLTRLFVSRLDTTPGRYVRLARAEVAAQLLSTALPLTTVASRSGFGSVAALRRAFADRFDTTPSQYRERLSRTAR